MEPQAQESVPRLSQTSGFNPSVNPSERRFVTHPPVFPLLLVTYAISPGSITRNGAGDLYELTGFRHMRARTRFKWILRILRRCGSSPVRGYPRSER